MRTLAAVSLVSLLALAPSSLAPAAHAQAARYRVLISVDMEGVAGTVTGDQLGPTGFEYGRFREFMTREALAAVNLARAGGATEIIVADAHGNGENLLRTWSRPRRFARSLALTVPT